MIVAFTYHIDGKHQISSIQRHGMHQIDDKTGAVFRHLG